MSTFITKKCPACRKVYARESYAGRPSKDNRTKYGSPIIQCQKCGNIFVDTDYREPALNGFRDVDKMRVSPGAVVYTLIGIIIAVCTFYGGYKIAGILIAIGSLWLSLDEICGFKKRQKMNEELLAESQKRIENPTYVLLLKKMGYNVPDSALQKAVDSIRNEN